MLRVCRSLDAHYEIVEKVEEGTYGVVYRGKELKTGAPVALKLLKLEGETEGFPVVFLREINALISIPHPNIVGIREVVIGRTAKSVYIVMDFIDHDLRHVMDDLMQRGHGLAISEVKTLMKQLFSAIACMHDRWIIHRDLKSTNLLLTNDGQIRVADFGLARRLGSPPPDNLTPLVQTLWYRAPELLLGATQYTSAIDCWSLGCIMAEMLTGKPLFQGRSELDQLDRIFNLLGPPTPHQWPTLVNLPSYGKIRMRGPNHSRLGDQVPMLSPQGLDLIEGLLTYDPERRLTCKQAMEHEWFLEAPLPKDPHLFPSWPNHRKRFKNQ